MIELMQKIRYFQESLDNMNIFKDINNDINNIKLNKELLDKIKKYNYNFNTDLRNDIYNHKEINEYKKHENEVNLMIFEINNKLKKISINRSCNHESN